MKKNKINYWLTAVFFAIYLISFSIDFFTEQSITVVSFGMCIGALLLFFLFLRKLKPIYYIGIIVFTFFAQFLGAMLDMYTKIPIYDKILHLSSGILLVFLGHYAYELLTQKYNNLNVPLKIELFFSSLFSIASAGVWEIWEYSGDTLFDLTSQREGITDTMTDIIAGTIGAVIGTFLLLFYLKREQKEK